MLFSHHLLIPHQVHPAQRKANLHQDNSKDSRQHSKHAHHDAADKHNLLAGCLGVDVCPVEQGQQWFDESITPPLTALHQAPWQSHNTPAT